MGRAGEMALGSTMYYTWHPSSTRERITIEKQGRAHYELLGREVQESPLAAETKNLAFLAPSHSPAQPPSLTPTYSCAHSPAQPLRLSLSALDHLPLPSTAASPSPPPSLAATT